MPRLLSRTISKLTRTTASSPMVPISRGADRWSQPSRELESIHGELTHVDHSHIGGIDALEAELDSDAEPLTLIWLGRSAIAGISPGTRLAVQGRIGYRSGHRVLFNPRYRLQP